MKIIEKNVTFVMLGFHSCNIFLFMYFIDSHYWEIFKLIILYVLMMMINRYIITCISTFPLSYLRLKVNINKYSYKLKIMYQLQSIMHIYNVICQGYYQLNMFSKCAYSVGYKTCYFISYI